MPERRKPQTKSGTTRAKSPSDRRLGVTLLSAGAAALGLGAAFAALFLRRKAAPADGPADGHAVPDLAPDAPSPQLTTAPSNAEPEAAAALEVRAEDHFRPDPTAIPTAAEREALRPATGPAPTLVADRGSITADTQDAA